MTPRIEKTAVTPTQLVVMLEQARTELDRNQPAVARRYVMHALARLHAAKTAQDVVLDANAKIAEPRPPRVVEPQHPREEA
jgi:hypothetical protein